MKNIKKLIFLLAIFVLFSKSSAFATKLLNIAFVGDFASGKTQLRSVASGRKYSLVRAPTLRTDVFSEPLAFGNTSLMCNLYDTSGNEKVKDYIIKERIKDAHIVVITVDASKISASGDVKELLSYDSKTFQKWVSIVRELHHDSYILLAVTKIDTLIDSFGRSKLNELDRMCDHLRGFCAGLDYVLTSAATGENIGDMNAGGDFGNNFWGKVRTIVRDKNLLPNLPKWNDREEFRWEKDDVNRWWCEVL